jgi:hypothetical protein
MFPKALVGMILYAEWQTEIYRPPPIKDVSDFHVHSRKLNNTAGYHSHQRFWEHRPVCRTINFSLPFGVQTLLQRLMAFLDSQLLCPPPV